VAVRVELAEGVEDDQVGGGRSHRSASGWGEPRGNHRFGAVHASSRSSLPVRHSSWIAISPRGGIWYFRLGGYECRATYAALIASGAIFPRLVAVVRAIVERKSGEPVSA
jgi:hypothetical protein